MAIIRLLREERSFRRLWLAQVVSELGDWFQLVALVSMFPTRGNGAAIVAGIFVARSVVAAVMSPIGGVLADRFPRGAVMIAADLARALVALGFVFVRGPEDVVAIYVLSLLLEALSVVFEPARGAAVPQLIRAEHLFSANALGGATWSTMFAIGSLAGGVVASLVGRKAAFAVNAASFVASALLVLSARVPKLPAKTRESHPIRDLADGVAYLRAHRAQASLLVLKPGALLAGASFLLVSVFADRVFAGDNAITMGWLLAGRGLGALVLPLALARFAGKDVGKAMRILLVAFPVAIAGFMAFAGSPTILLAAAALFVAHGSTSSLWVASSSLLQLTVPNHVLGRVLSVELALVTLAIAFSGVFVGALLSRFDVAPRVAAAAMGALLVAPFVLFVRARAVHRAALEAAASRDSGE